MINKSGSASSEWGEVSNEDMFYELHNNIKFIQTFTVRFLPKNMWKGVLDSFLKYDKVRVAICTKILPNFSNQLPDRQDCHITCKNYEIIGQNKRKKSFVIY